MNYKLVISYNSRKIVVEFTFSTLIVFVFTFCLIVLLSVKYVEQFIFCRTLQMDFLEGSTSICSFSSKVEISFCKVEILNLKIEFHFCKEVVFNIIRKHIEIHSSFIGSHVYTRDRETRSDLVISLDLERAPLHSFQESKYLYV